MLIPIIAGAILGLAMDYRDMSLKHDYIFDPNDIAKNTVIIPKTYTESRYRMITSCSDFAKETGISGELAVRASKGLIDLSGYGKYLMKTREKTNTVEMMFSVYHEMLTETFPSYCKLRTDWQSKPQGKVGSHYIHSITYGGQLMISYVMKATKTEYLEDIKAAVKANVDPSGASWGVGAEGDFKKLAEDIANISTTEITTYATTAPFNPPSSLEDCFKLMKEYPSLVKKVNGGKGAPLKIDIVDLSTLSRNYTAYLRNDVLEGMLQDVNDKYDDLRVATEAYDNWENSINWGPEWDDAVNDFHSRLKNARDKMSAAIINLNETEGTTQFDPAYEAYGGNIPGKYMRELTNLTHHVEGKPFFWFPYTTAVSSYVHWGSVNCTLPSPQPLYVGYAATSPLGFGSGGNIECLPAKVELKEKEVGSTVKSEINGLKYLLPDNTSGRTLCAFCKLENATVTYAISGRTECPEDLKLEYRGYWMTSRDAGTGSSFVCLDQHPDENVPGDYQNFNDDSTATLTPVWNVCPDCDEDENQKFVSCVVCSR